MSNVFQSFTTLGQKISSTQKMAGEKKNWNSGLHATMASWIRPQI